MILVTSIKDTFRKDEALSFAATAPGVTTGGRITKHMKPVKVPSWSKDMSLEIFTKKLMTWKEINDKVPELMKFHDVIERFEDKQRHQRITKVCGRTHSSGLDQEERSDHQQGSQASVC